MGFVVLYIWLRGIIKFNAYGIGIMGFVGLYNG